MQLTEQVIYWQIINSFGLANTFKKYLGTKYSTIYHSLTCDLVDPKKMRPLLECWPILLCWGKIRPNPWLKYNASYFQGLVGIHLDLVWQKYCDFPEKDDMFFFTKK